MARQPAKFLTLFLFNMEKIRIAGAILVDLVNYVVYIG